MEENEFKSHMILKIILKIYRLKRLQDMIDADQI